MSVIPSVKQQTQKRLSEVSSGMVNDDIEEDMTKRRCTTGFDMTELEVELSRIAAADEEEYIASYEDPQEYYEEMIKEAERVESRNRMMEEMDQEDFDELDRGFDIPKQAFPPTFAPGQWFTGSPWASTGGAPQGW